MSSYFKIWTEWKKCVFKLPHDIWIVLSPSWLDARVTGMANSLWFQQR